MIIKMLQEQLEVANATIRQMASSMRAMEKTIANLEALLKERDTSLAKAQNQMRGLSKLVENKSERQKPEQPAPKTEEEKNVNLTHFCIINSQV